MPSSPHPMAVPDGAGGPARLLRLARPVPPRPCVLPCFPARAVPSIDSRSASSPAMSSWFGPVLPSCLSLPAARRKEGYGKARLPARGRTWGACVPNPAASRPKCSALPAWLAGPGACCAGPQPTTPRPVRPCAPRSRTWSPHVYHPAPTPPRGRTWGPVCPTTTHEGTQLAAASTHTQAHRGPDPPGISGVPFWAPDPVSST
jgi:hypothetical protein